MIKCPYCGESYYQEGYTVSTAMYCPPIYKNGKLIIEDDNYHTTHCTCLNCGKAFNYVRHKGENYVYIPKEM